MQVRTYTWRNASLPDFGDIVDIFRTFFSLLVHGKAITIDAVAVPRVNEPHVTMPCEAASVGSASLTESRPVLSNIQVEGKGLRRPIRKVHALKIDETV